MKLPTFLAHLLRLHKRYVTVWETRNGKLMRGTLCQCGQLTDIRPLAQAGQKRGKFQWS